MRTLLVVFSIAVGVFSIGVITGAYEIISNDMDASYAANNPANIELRMSGFDDDILTSIQNAKGIKEAEGRRVANFRVRTQNSTQWITIDLVAMDSFSENQVNLLAPIEGQSEAKKDEIVLDKKALEKIDISIGEDLIFELPDGSTKALRVVGIVQDASTGAGDFLAPPFAFTVMDTMQTLRQPETYNRVFATVLEGPNDLAHIRVVGGDLRDKLEKNGTSVARIRYSERNKHPLTDVLNAVLGILLALGILIVFLSSSLIANTLSALLNQHLRHIGVIKLVGGSTRQVFIMYLTLIMAFAAMALLIAVPAGGWGAYALADYIALQLNFQLLGYRIVPLAFVVQIVVGLLVPLIAGLSPVLNGSRITVIRALSNDLAGDESKPQTGQQTRVNWLDWMLIRFTRVLAVRGIHVPRPFIISLRNTFRKRGRLLLTLFTLTMGGAIFISVFNVRTSLREYTNQIGSYFRADVTVDFDRAYRINEVEKVTSHVEGVERVEGWQFISTELLYPDGTVADSINLLAPPAESDLVNPILVSGRWILPTDVRKLAISEAVIKFYPGLQAGDNLLLKVDGREEAWQVVGIFKFVGREGILAYTPLEYSEKVLNLSNRSYSYRVVASDHSREYQDDLAERLDDEFRSAGFKVRQAESGLASLDTVSESLDILIVFLLIMAVLTAIVGAMGLTGTMGMNVLERTREIGIMRAIGADDVAVMRTVIGEGFVIGTISFLFSIVVSIPLTYLLATIVSLAIFETPIDVIFTWLGYAIWFGLVLLLSVFGSILPARNAARLTIREVLAYE
ncbi:MAG: ABC transporter permease [Anaerolineales bacterium]|nr:ABC transporter permease [Anaerolineales bacterium]MCB9144198.1 ABC transporter permease [Anaerolineales bacterium]